MGNFDQKVDKFIDIFLDQNGYVKVVQGLQNTLLIALRSDHRYRDWYFDRNSPCDSKI